MGIFSSKDAQDVIDRLHMDDSSNGNYAGWVINISPFVA